MKRLYDSTAVDRDDSDPFRPNEREETTKPQAARSLPQRTLSRLLVPQAIHQRGVTVSLDTPKAEYTTDESVPIAIQMRNRLPFPVAIKTVSPVRWVWWVDDTRQTDPDPVAGTSETMNVFAFDRGERKRFTRKWSQMEETSDGEWQQVSPGDHTISVAVNVENPEQRGLRAETTVALRW